MPDLESVPKALNSLFWAMSLEPEALAARHLVRTEPTEVVMNSRYLDDCLTRLRRMFVVLAQTTIASHPNKPPSPPPAALQRYEPPLPDWAAHHHHPVRSVMHAQPAIQVVVVVL